MIRALVVIFIPISSTTLWSPEDPYKCFEYDSPPVDTSAIFNDYCKDNHGNIYKPTRPEDPAPVKSCCECLGYTCIYVDTYRDQKVYRWNVSVSDHCCLHCDGVVYKADTVIDTTQHEDECKTSETSVCRILPGLNRATIESEFNYKNCCNDNDGLSTLNTKKLEPKSCSERECYYTDALPFSTWISFQALSGCDCCILDGKLVADGHSWVHKGKVFECCRGEIVIKLSNDTLPPTSTSTTQPTTTTTSTTSMQTTTTTTTSTTSMPTTTTTTQTTSTKTTTTTQSTTITTTTTKIAKQTTQSTTMPTTTTQRKTTPEPTPTEKVLLHSDKDYEYYKVAVAEGSKLKEGKVSETCEQAGMRALCSGPKSCEYTNLAMCTITPLSTDCGNPMQPLSKIICNGANPRSCKALEGVFNYMYKWSGSEAECGAVKGRWCAFGSSYTVGPNATYFGLCAMKITTTKTTRKTTKT